MKLAEFFKKNVGNVIGIIFGLILLGLGIKIAQRLENYYTKKKVKGLIDSLNKVTVKYGITQLDFENIKNSLFFYESLGKIKSEVNSGKYENIFKDEDKKTILNLTKDLKYFCSSQLYEYILNIYLKFLPLDPEEKVNTTIMLRRVGIIKNNIFSEMKTWIFGVSKNDMSKWIVQSFKLQLKDEEKGVKTVRDFFENPLTESEKQMPFEDALKELKQINKASLTKNSQKNLKTVIYLAKAEINMNKAKRSWVPKTLRILAPIVAVCAGVAAKKSIDLYANKNGASR